MLEELILQSAASPEIVPVVSSAQRSDLEKFLRQSELSDSAVNRILGAVDRIGAKGAKNVLYDWLGDGVLGIEKADISAWDELRNRAAHGKFLMLETAKGQRQIDAFYRVCNLVNKLVLSASGYDGQYFDYVRWAYLPFASNPMRIGDPANRSTGQAE